LKFIVTYKKEDLLKEYFLKQFKNVEEMELFLKEHYKRGVQSMLEGEMKVHLGYPTQ